MYHIDLYLYICNFHSLPAVTLTLIVPNEPVVPNDQHFLQESSLDIHGITGSLVVHYSGRHDPEILLRTN